MTLSILINGGTGFIDFNSTVGFLRQHADEHIINLELLIYASSILNLHEVIDDPRHVFVIGDIYQRPC